MTTGTVMEMEMETEESEVPIASSVPAFSHSSSSKRLGVKNTVHTTFGDDYIFQIASSPETQSLGVSLSTKKIRLYSSITSQYLGECTGHSDPINGISFTASGHVICSCSTDGTVRAWDTRDFKEIFILEPANTKEIYSFCIGGSSNNLLAAGCGSEIVFWDLRERKQVSSLEESHFDDVTQVQFVPNQPNILLSSSDDGLICMYDINSIGHINDDDNLESVMNVGTSVSKFGFFGQTNQKLWCLTQIQAMSIWDWQNGRKEIDFEEARSEASKCWNLDQIDYFVDCIYSGEDDRLLLIGGTDDGALGYFPVCSVGSGNIGSAEAILDGGHTGIVRSVLPGSTTDRKGVFAWSGGEDARLCCWSSSEEKQSSWISNSLAMRSSKFISRNRHHPY